MAIHDIGLSLAKRDDDNPQNTSASGYNLLWTVVPALISFVAMVIGFIILRRSNPRTYMPRTYLGTLRVGQRTPESPTGLFNWISSMYRLPDTYVLQHHSLDAYLLLRFLKLITIICFVGCCITWPVLFPVNATGQDGQSQLDILSISNIKNKARYFAHAFIAWIYIGYIFFTITRECIFYINLRQAYLLCPAYASRLSSRTVLFTTVTHDYLNKEKLMHMFGPEKVRNVWIASDTSKLEDKVQRREEAAMKLEAAEVKLIRKVNKARLKSLKKSKGNSEIAESDVETASIASRWIKASDRPTHRLKPLIGKKVDTINWCRAEIERLSRKIDDLQAKHRAGGFKLVSSVFVEFHIQADAQAAFQSVAHNLPLHMAPRYIGLDPSQVIWENLRIMWWERIIRYTGTVAFVIALTIFWAIPTAVVGFISDVNYIIKVIPWLGWIGHAPQIILGFISGLLPSILMSVLISMVPVVFRLMAKLGGAPSLAAVELTTQNFFFTFQVIQTFLVVTLSSAATSVVSDIIHNPTSAPQLLARNLPKASHFYISYITLQGLSFSSGALLQLSGLIVGKITSWAFDDTPRKIYTRWSTLSGLGWGTVYPSLSLLAVVAVTYSCIAPLVLGFATIGLYLFYFAYRYDLLYVSNADIDTQGQAYIRALQHMTVGCYLSMVCLIGLFAIGIGDDRVSLGPMILMIILLVFIILYHVSLNQAIDPLIQFLPRNLEAEEEALLAQERPKLGEASDDYPTKDVMTTSSDQNGAAAGGGGGIYDHHRDNSVDTAEKGLTGSTTMPNQAQQAPNFFMKYLRPDKYSDYAALRRLVPNASEAISYSPEVEKDAYLHPAINAQLPLLWIPRDELGLSQQEIEHSGRVVPITDEGAWLDEKNKIHWDVEDGKPPIYEEKVYY